MHLQSSSCAKHKLAGFLKLNCTNQWEGAIKKKANRFLEPFSFSHINRCCTQNLDEQYSLALCEHINWGKTICFLFQTLAMWRQKHLDHTFCALFCSLIKMAGVSSSEKWNENVIRVNITSGWSGYWFKHEQTNADEQWLSSFSPLLSGLVRLRKANCAAHIPEQANYQVVIPWILCLQADYVFIIHCNPIPIFCGVMLCSIEMQPDHPSQRFGLFNIHFWASSHPPRIWFIRQSCETQTVCQFTSK